MINAKQRMTHMNKLKSFTLAALLLAPLPTLQAAEPASASGTDLEKAFVTPPDAVRPSCYWWWFNSLMDKESITRDLEEFKAKGMGGVMMVWTGNGFGTTPMPEGPKFLSPEWRELFKHALKEADRLKLELGVNLCGGWCMGGPWITPEHSGRWFLQSELTLTGPQKFSGKLPLPGPKNGYDSEPMLQVANSIDLPLDKVDYRDTAVVAFHEPAGGSHLGESRAKDLAAKSNRRDGSVFVPAREVTEPPLTPWAAQPDDHPIAPGEVIDLTSKLGADGTLEWDVPEGSWTLVRTGHRITGSKVMLPMSGSDGLEVDWLSAAAVDRQWEHMAKPILDDAGPLAGKTLKYFATDSFEDGYPNWTARMLEQFKRYRGYDMQPYLPVLAGRLIGSAEVSDRFLYDYRKTVADCIADNNYGRLAELSHKEGMSIACEAAGPSWSMTVCMDALKNLGRCDMPQGEFWQSWHFVENDQNKVGKQTATAAHIYGRRTASAEAFTCLGSGLERHWGNMPANLKTTADRAFCEGINRLVFHTMTAARPQDGMPGYEYGAGTHFNPNVTWWQQAAGPWIRFVSRCQALLQAGRFVADVLDYNGDWAPNLVEPKHVDPALGKGYDYDVCNAEVLLTRLSVKDGRLVLPDGMSYRLLVLPESKRMPVEVVQKIRELVKAGATVIGPKPLADPGLKDYPHCDAEVKMATDEVWGDCDGQTVKQRTCGKGRVFWGETPRSILAADGVPPDFEHSGDGAFIDFIHRTTADMEIYFMANRNNRMEKVDGTFRVADRQPELWDPVTGNQRDLPEYRKTQDGRTTVPLEFVPNGSMFVVFRDSRQETGDRRQNETKNFPESKPLQEIAGQWAVQFDPQWFYPDKEEGGRKKADVTFEQLEDWSKRPEPAIQHFSGTAVYRKTFALADPSAIRNPQSTIYLDLGTVKETARVKLNGKDLGVVWCAPWRVEITGAVRPGENALEIEVVNLWPNRLVGDAKLPAEQRRTHTNITTDPKQPLLTSGLLGPVRVIKCE